MEESFKRIKEKLASYGLKKEDIIKLVKALQEDSAISAYQELLRVLENLSDEEKEKLDSDLEKADEIDRQIILANLYFEKTGKKYLDKVFEIWIEHLTIVVSAFENMKKMAEKLKPQVGPELDKKLQQIIDAKDWNSIVPILKEIGLSEDDFKIQVN